MKRTLVYSYLDRKDIYALRQSNQTMLVRRGKIIDSDRAIITDKYGHRYARRISLEAYAPQFFVFELI